MEKYCVYILASERNGTLYVGVTNDPIRRIYEHKKNLIEGFTKKYHIHNLVYIEWTSDINEALRREKNLKAWKRDWKIQLIEQTNPYWHDLYDNLDKDTGS
ncbi:MAG: GIY-YIG nuclease, partial [Candidatus Omnitrophica bacterium CG12_big_fil_rev_8_21_14_0_65_50_5]